MVPDLLLFRYITASPIEEERERNQENQWKGSPSEEDEGVGETSAKNRSPSPNETDIGKRGRPQSQQKKKPQKKRQKEKETPRKNIASRKFMANKKKPNPRDQRVASDSVAERKKNDGKTAKKNLGRKKTTSSRNSSAIWFLFRLHFASAEQFFFGTLATTLFSPLSICSFFFF